jgi:hypothetical protein
MTRRNIKNMLTQSRFSYGFIGFFKYVVVRRMQPRTYIREVYVSTKCLIPRQEGFNFVLFYLSVYVCVVTSVDTVFNFRK